MRPSQLGESGLQPQVRGERSGRILRDVGDPAPASRPQLRAGHRVRPEQFQTGGRHPAGPHLEALASSTREVASLGIPLGPDEVLYLRQVVAPGQLVQAVGWVGRTIPRRDTALGMALDGRLGAEGYAISSRPENEVDAVAAPVYDHYCRIVGALSISAPRYRTSVEDLQRFGRLLVVQAAQLSATLGASAEAIAGLRAQV
jgi:DNA-binding IclR family transcriptional regulator